MNSSKTQFNFTDGYNRLLLAANVHARNLLGAMFTYPELHESVIQTVNADDFRDDMLRRAYEIALKSFDMDKCDYDATIIEIESGSDEELKRTIRSLITDTVIAADSDVKDYARMLVDDNFKLNAIDGFLTSDNGMEMEAALRADAQARIDKLGVEMVEGLPRRIIFNGELFDNPPAPPPELVEGILRKGHKMIISGASKTGKSFLAMELAVAIADGGSWLGHRCAQGRVLYLNLEIDGASCVRRLVAIEKALGKRPDNANLEILNMRGYCEPLDKLKYPIINLAKANNYSAIIFDPIYKVLTGDENDASEMAAFVANFDQIATQTRAAVIYVHHHSKGAQGTKNSNDRFSGSGVFGRDPDAIIDVARLQRPEGLVNLDGAIPLQFSASLREFVSPDPVNLWFKHPIHIMDTDGDLRDAVLEGCAPKKTKDDHDAPDKVDGAAILRDKFDEAFAEAEKNGRASILEVATRMEKDRRTIRGYVAAKLTDSYYTNDGYIYRKNDP